MAVRGVDLAEMWASRRWRKLLNLIDRLPRDSHYTAARMDDPDVAARLAALPRSGASTPLTEFAASDAILAGIHDRLGVLISAAIRQPGSPPPKLQPWPRPVTEVDRARDRAHRMSHEALVARVLHPSRKKG